MPSSVVVFGGRSAVGVNDTGAWISRESGVRAGRGEESPRISRALTVVSIARLVSAAEELINILTPKILAKCGEQPTLSKCGICVPVVVEVLTLQARIFLRCVASTTEPVRSIQKVRRAIRKHPSGVHIRESVFAEDIYVRMLEIIAPGPANMPASVKMVSIDLCK